jgi:MORN repeat variant
MIEPGKKIEEIPEFAPLLKVIDNPLKANIVAFFQDNPTKDEDPSGIAHYLGDERIKLISDEMVELEKAGLFGSRVDGVMRTNYYHLTPDARMKEALDLIFKKVGTRNYWTEFNEYLDRLAAGKNRGRRGMFIAIMIVVLAGLAVAGYFIFDQLQEQKRTRQLEAMTQGSGVRKSEYPNGKSKSEITYSHGDRHGPFTTWFENGKKMAVGTYRNNLPHGEWTFWDQTGKELKVVTYREGRAVIE